MFVRAMEIIREECKGRKSSRLICKRLLDETDLSKEDATSLVSDTLDAEALKHAESLVREMVVASGIPEPTLNRMLSGERTKTIAALRTAIRHRLYAETRLSHREINMIVGLSGNSRHMSGQPKV